MKKEDIRELEPKYTGNTRHLTEGEAAAIVNDPANQSSDEEGMSGMLSTVIANRIADEP